MRIHGVTRRVLMQAAGKNIPKTGIGPRGHRQEQRQQRYDLVAGKEAGDKHTCQDSGDREMQPKNKSKDLFLEGEKIRDWKWSKEVLTQFPSHGTKAQEKQVLPLRKPQEKPCRCRARTQPRCCGAVL